MERRKPRRKAVQGPKRGIAWPRWTGFGGKTFWDWLQLLVVPLAVSLALAALGVWFTMQRAQDEALQAYLDQMSTLLLENDLRDAEGNSEVRTLARARTLTVLERLNPSRKTQVIRFLSEASLVQSWEGRDRVISLDGADLRGIDLSYDAPGGDEVIGATVPAYDLSSADMTYADLREANLSGITMDGTRLVGADLRGADMRGTVLFEANLAGADLSGANLRDASYLTQEQLERAASLEGATMPDGSIQF